MHGDGLKLKVTSDRLVHEAGDRTCNHWCPKRVVYLNLTEKIVERLQRCLAPGHKNIDNYLEDLYLFVHVVCPGQRLDVI